MVEPFRLQSLGAQAGFLLHVVGILMLVLAIFIATSAYALVICVLQWRPEKLYRPAPLPHPNPLGAGD